MDFRKILCMFGIHKTDYIKIELGEEILDTQLSKTSCIKKCNCGHARLLYYNKDTLFVRYKNFLEVKDK